MDQKDKIILQQLDVIRSMTENSMKRMNSDFWGAPQPKTPYVPENSAAPKDTGKEQKAAAAGQKPEEKAEEELPPPEKLEDLLAEQIVMPFYKEYQGYLPQMDEYLDKTIVEYRAKPGCRAVIHYVIQNESNAENEYCKEEITYCNIPILYFVCRGKW